jgi:hypothetical protein
MRSGSLLAALMALAVMAPTVRPAEKIALNVLYAGNPDSPRTKDFVAFLRQHFVKVGETSYEKFKPDEAKGYDVVVFDWTSIYPRDKNGKINQNLTSLDSPKAPPLGREFDRPAVLIGAAGGFLAGHFQLKIDWL